MRLALRENQPHENKRQLTVGQGALPPEFLSARFPSSLYPRSKRELLFVRLEGLHMQRL